MLGAWSTYSLSDFLMFSRETYRRLFELMNEALWPAPLAVAALGLVVLWLVARPRGAPGHVVSARVAVVLLAVAWAWVAWDFHLGRFAPINLAAPWFAAAFFLEVILLAAVALVATPPHGTRWSWRIGTALLGFAVVAQPLLGPLAGRSWAAIGLAGLAPDPTVVATLGAVVAGGWSRWLLLPIPVAWCAVSGATAWALDAPEGLVTPVAAIVALAGAWPGRRGIAPPRAPASKTAGR